MVELNSITLSYSVLTYSYLDVGPKQLWNIPEIVLFVLWMKEFLDIITDTIRKCMMHSYPNQMNMLLSIKRFAPVL